ncbi:substrate-binding periplasmic protein [Marinobacterium mangrovicola]|uniref:Amino acid ABC transporter substrate-binding protein (PAAT family) n=1 Tax=Marinobacterium mangrovicola TaxID=1476959 RepID=A0A4R1GNZ1_9GAMM|nr:transporter substrate-binding domain-containing protein [Marinobacterium mangrovicola]TCK09111.1 amino acid ABC transporter substrate-binding protein (PAAT family) [Marinobacterium mangrovicola]
MVKGIKQFVLPVVLSCWSFLAAAETAPIIKIAMPEDFYPFYAVERDGTPTGASYEIAAAVLEKLGYAPQVTQYSDMRGALQSMASGSQDLMVNLTPTPDRDKLALFTSTPHIYETQDFIARADSPIEYNGRLLSVAQFKIGVNYGWTYGPEFDATHYLTKAPVLDSMAQLKGLLSGTFDLAINNQQYFLSSAEKLGVSNAFKVLTPSVYVLPVNLAVSRRMQGAEAFRDQLEREVAEFISTPEYLLILSKYGFKPRAETAQ